ncbi:hypothetical protein AUC45_15400 [Erythrobacter sp. YT30]|nr:hypothetical protein AUC45_15400 [Erythrobacter sp. YT30]
MLLAIGLRTALGAPCCAPLPQMEAAALASDHGAHSIHAHALADAGDHAEHANGHVNGHGDDPSANSCCSACGPTIPPEPGQFAAAALIREIPEPAPIRALATRPSYPAYEATGPPLLI